MVKFFKSVFIAICNTYMISFWVIIPKIVMVWNAYIVFFIKIPSKEILQCYEIKFIFYSFYTSSCFLDIFRNQNRRVGSLEAISSARGLSQMRTLLEERLHPIAEWQLFMIVMRNETCFRKEFRKWVSHLCTVNFFFIIFVMLALTIETVGDGEST